MKINRFLVFGLILVVTTVYTACRKVDIPNEKKEFITDQKWNKFFSQHPSSDKQVQSINLWLSKMNVNSDFVKLTTERVGFPRWDKAMLYRASNAGGRGNADSAIITFIPFVRDGQDYVNASLMVITTATDTTTSWLCDWHYSAYNFNPPASSSISAIEAFIFFAKFDRHVFGRNEFSITDHRLFYCLTGMSVDSNKNYIIRLDSTAVAGRPGVLIAPVDPTCLMVYEYVALGYTVIYHQIGNWCIIDDISFGNTGGGSGSGTGGGGGGTPPPPECQPPVANRGMNAQPPGTGCPLGWQPIPYNPPIVDPCSNSDASSGASATSQYIGLNSTVQQFASFDLTTTTQPEQFFVVNNISGSNVPGSIQTSTPNGGSISQSVTPNTVIVVHTHPFGGIPGPSAGDYFTLASFGSNFQISYIVAYDGTKYAIVINDLPQFQQFTAHYTSSLNPDGSLDPNSTLGVPFYGLRQLLISQGYSFDEAHERALAFIMNQAGVRLTKAAIGSNTFKKIGIRQKVINGVLQIDLNGFPIFENADCP